MGDTSFDVDDASSFSVGDEITLCTVGETADGTHDDEVTCVIASISSNTITVEDDIVNAHADGDIVRSGVHVYPITFLGGGMSRRPVAEGVGLYPEVRVSIHPDKLGRINYVGWYGIMGYKIIRSKQVINLMTSVPKI